KRGVAAAQGAAFVAVLGVVGGVGGGVAAKQSRRTASIPSRGVELHVPHAAGSIVLDGDMDDPGWLRAGPARTNAFVLADGTAARPYSDARLVWADDHLYIALYAADQDIRATQIEPDSPLWLEDAFEMVFSDGDTERTIDISPRGVVTDAQRLRGGAPDYTWSSGAIVSHEMDGTPNDPR